MLIPVEHPTKYPQFFTTVSIHGYPYWKPVRIGMGLEDDIQAAIDAVYSDENPAELIDGVRIDQAKRQEWYQESYMTHKKLKRIFADVLTPQPDSPDMDIAYQYMPVELWSEIYDFLSPNETENRQSVILSSGNTANFSLKDQVEESLPLSPMPSTLHQPSEPASIES